MKIHTTSINEGFSAGYVSSLFDDAAGFSYTILPLSFNLQQKGNSKLNTKGIFKFYPGDHVKGINISDEKEHSGIIRYLYNEPGVNKVKLVYILDDKNNSILPLKANTVKKTKYHINEPRLLDFFKKNQNNITLLSVHEAFDFNQIKISKKELLKKSFDSLRITFKDLWEYANEGDILYCYLGCLYNVEQKGIPVGVILKKQKTLIVVCGLGIAGILNDTTPNFCEEGEKIYNNYHPGDSNGWVSPAYTDIKTICHTYYAYMDKYITKEQMTSVYEGNYVHNLMDGLEYDVTKKLYNLNVYLIPILTLRRTEIRKKYGKNYIL